MPHKWNVKKFINYFTGFGSIQHTFINVKNLFQILFTATVASKNIVADRV